MSGCAIALRSVGQGRSRPVLGPIKEQLSAPTRGSTVGQVTTRLLEKAAAVRPRSLKLL